MTIHSQGPWRAIAPPTADNGNPWRVVDQFNHGIAIVTCSPREGNAKLIAAAPTMESELDALRAEIERLRNALTEIHQYDLPEDVHVIIRQALVRHKGP